MLIKFAGTATATVQCAVHSKGALVSKVDQFRAPEADWMNFAAAGGQIVFKIRGSNSLMYILLQILFDYYHRF